MRVISYGGGVQSTALVILAATGQIDADAAVFANVGDDSEHPLTLPFVRDVVMPWAAERGFPVHETQRVRRDGTPETLLQKLHRTERSVDIPVRGTNGAPGKRSCTADFKIKVVERWLRAHGATKDNKATVLIGFSTDELERANTKRTSNLSVPEYPLLDLGWNRSRCQSLIVETFGQPAPKSSCWFCPFHRPHMWAEMRRDEPDLFWRSVDLERMLNDRRERLGKDHVYLTRFAKPLDEAITEAQPTLFADGPEGCDEGYCWT